MNSDDWNLRGTEKHGGRKSAMSGDQFVVFIHEWRVCAPNLTGPDHSLRTSKLSKAAVEAKKAQDAKLAETQAELGRALSALTEARSIAERQSDVSEAEEIIRRVAPDLGSAEGDRSERLRRRVAERKTSIPALMEAIGQAEIALAEDRYFTSEGLTRAVELTALVDEREAALSKATETLRDAEDAARIQEETDAFAAHMVALLEHGEEIGLIDGHCPLCDAARSNAEFTEAIAAARARLQARGEAAARASEVRSKARAALSQAEQDLSGSVPIGGAREEGEAIVGDDMLLRLLVPASDLRRIVLYHLRRVAEAGTVQMTKAELLDFPVSPATADDRERLLHEVGIPLRSAAIDRS